MRKIKKKEKLSNGDKITFGEATYIFSAPDFGDRPKGEELPVYELVSVSNGKKFVLEYSGDTLPCFVEWKSMAESFHLQIRQIQK